MVTRVLIIGGFGNFGGYIARSLAGDANILLLIGGWSKEKALAFSASLDAVHPAEGHALDIGGDVGGALKRIAPDVVIHTTGPFQMQDHRVARACISQRRHYLDLADAREFVATIESLDAQAKANDVLVVSGASSVPCLTAAVIDAYLPGFERLESVDYGISTAQQTNRGLATTSAVLSYVGKPMSVLRAGGDDHSLRLGRHERRTLSRTWLASVWQLRHSRPHAVPATLPDAQIDAFRV